MNFDNSNKNVTEKPGVLEEREKNAPGKSVKGRKYLEKRAKENQVTPIRQFVGKKMREEENLGHICPSRN